MGTWTWPTTTTHRHSLATQSRRRHYFILFFSSPNISASSNWTGSGAFIHQQRRSAGSWKSSLALHLFITLAHHSWRIQKVAGARFHLGVEQENECLSSGSIWICAAAVQLLKGVRNLFKLILGYQGITNSKERRRHVSMDRERSLRVHFAKVVGSSTLTK